jgi:hypothetical protein
MAAAGSLAMFGKVGAALAQALRRTPDQILGPFYPVVKPLHQGADLTIIPGKPGAYPAGPDARLRPRTFISMSPARATVW